MTFFLLVLGPSYVIPVNYLVFCFCLIPLMFIFQPLAKVNSKYKSIRTFSFLKTFSWLPITFRTQSNLTVPARPHTIKHRPTSDLLINHCTLLQPQWPSCYSSISSSGPQSQPWHRISSTRTHLSQTFSTFRSQLKSNLFNLMHSTTNTAGQYLAPFSFLFIAVNNI